MTSRGLSLLGKVILYPACVRNVIIYGGDTCSVKNTHLIRLKKKMEKWFKKYATLGTIEDHGECLKSKRLRWSGHQKRMKGSSNQCVCGPPPPAISNIMVIKLELILCQIIFFLMFQ